MVFSTISKLASSLGARSVLAIALCLTSVRPATAEPALSFSLILSLTGTNAFIGDDFATTAHAFETFVNKKGGLNGRPLHFDILDDQSSPQVAVQLANQAAASRPAIIFGSDAFGQCAAIAPIMEHGPVNYCLSPGLSPKRDGFVFASSVALNFIEPAMIRYARLKGYRRLAMIATTDASGQGNESATTDALAARENSAITLVTRQHFNPADTTISAQVANIKAANPDALIVWANGGQFGATLRSLKEAGVDIPVMTSGANLNQVIMTQFNAYSPKTLLFNGIVYFGQNDLRRGPLRSRVDDFYNAFKAIGKVPTPSSGYAWDPFLIVFDALKHLGPSANANQLRDYLDNLRQFVGISGVYNFRDDHHGLTDSSVIMVKWNPQNLTFNAASRGGGVPLP